MLVSLYLLFCCSCFINSSQVIWLSLSLFLTKKNNGKKHNVVTPLNMIGLHRCNLSTFGSGRCKSMPTIIETHIYTPLLARTVNITSHPLTQRSTTIHIALKFSNRRLSFSNLSKLHNTTSFRARPIKQNLRQLNLSCSFKQLYQILIGSRPRQLCLKVTLPTSKEKIMSHTFRTMIC